MNPDPPNVDPVTFRVEQARTVLAAKVPPMFRDAAPSHPRIAAWVQQFLDNPATVPSLVMLGPTGVGKTWQAWGAIRRIVTTRAAAGETLRWAVVSHPGLNDELRPKPDGSHAWALDKYLDAELLVLDDLGAGKQTEWTGDSLHRLVDHRWQNRLPTVYSTNLPAGDLLDTVGERVVSRLAAATHVTITGEDRRWEGTTP